MAATRKPAVPSSKPRRPPATTPEARENQLIALAIDEAEKQIRNGTASSQILTHYLKLGTTREQLEKEKLRRENELLKARVEALASAARVEELYAEAIRAMAAYAGRDYVEMTEEYED